jgi:hypothetical protein
MDDPNKQNHIFANPKHNLDALVRHYGSEEDAVRAIVAAVNQARQAGKLSTDKLGVYKQVFDVGGHPAIVAGRIVNGLVRIGTAWISPHPWGWSVELGALTRAPRRRLVESVFSPPWEHGDDDA